MSALETLFAALGASGAVLALIAIHKANGDRYVAHCQRMRADEAERKAASLAARLSRKPKVDREKRAKVNDALRNGTVVGA